MTVGILTEKNSAMRNFAKALGGISGTYKGEKYVLTAARGHVYEFVDPTKMVSKAKAEQYASWELEHLPWDQNDFDWRRAPRGDVRDVISKLKTTLGQCDEIVIATDVDPSGEGQLIAWEIIDELGLSGKKISRMNFVDESPASLQKAFVNRETLPAMLQDPEYRKADFRTKFDMLSMQFTRVATKAAGQRAVLRQGRLKSAMVKIVGDGLAAHNNYQKVPFYDNRFRDENGVVYRNPDEPQFANRADVPAGLRESEVVLDSRENKHSAPPKLLDLAGLSSMLSGKGVKAKDVLATYQKMYESQIVSYPRTEDRTVTPEQFNELLPKIDAIAKVVGVDPALLTNRQPRKSHVKPQGAHGANRPGTTVPSSLSELETKFGKIAPMIYEILAKNYLAIHAPDYAYEQQKGHVKDYPAFVGVANIPKSMGFKAVFSTDDEMDEDSNAKGLGHTATPFINEGFPKRPPHPTMKWLMSQLEKRDVGTGATRTSIYADVTNEKTKFPLLIEKRGKITMSEFGDMSYYLLADTHIGDLSVTESLYADMREVAAGTKTAEQALAPMADWVRDDIKTMTANAVTMRKELKMPEIVKKEKATGTFNGEQVTFNREWGGHKFTDAEVADLLAGKEIQILGLTSKAGKKYGVKGRLAHLEFSKDGKTYKYVGFDRTGFADTGIPEVFCQHRFTDEERQALENGDTIRVADFVSKKGNKFAAAVSWGQKDGEDRKSLILNFGD